MIKYNFVIVLIVMILFPACFDETSPRKLVIRDIPAESFEGEISDIQNIGGDLKIILDTSSLGVKNIPDNLKKISYDFDYIKVVRNDKPSGISLNIYLFKNGEELVRIGYRTPFMGIIISDWRIITSSDLDEDSSDIDIGERKWVDVILKNNDSLIHIATMKPESINVENDIWDFVLLGALTPVEGKNDNISREIDPLSAYWILVKR